MSEKNEGGSLSLKETALCGLLGVVFVLLGSWQYFSLKNPSWVQLMFLVFTSVLFFVVTVWAIRRPSNSVRLKRFQGILPFGVVLLAQFLIHDRWSPGDEVMLTHPNGSQSAKGYRNDHGKTGRWVYWDDKGRILSRITYRDGIEDGPCTYFYIPDGPENSLKKEEGGYEDGKKVGVWSYWNEDGTLDRTETYKLP